MNVSQIMIIGNLTKDAQTFKAQNGDTTYLRCTVAVSERPEKTVFYPVTIFKNAEKLAPHLVKGKQVCVIGPGDSGRGGYLNGIIAEKIEFGASPKSKLETRVKAKEATEAA